MATIINVSVNGMTATECAKSVKARFVTIDKSQLNIAVLCAYGTGVEIPAYGDKAAAICDKPLSQKAFCLLIDRNKATISRYIKAVELIIKNNDFACFADGLYPFNFDKVILVYENIDKLSDYSKADLFRMSLADIRNLLAEDSEEKPEEDEKVQFTYDGKVYQVGKSKMTEFLKKCVETVAE